MNKEIMELEFLLNQEIEAYSKIEEYITDKNSLLVKGEMEKVKTLDEELEKYNFIIEKLERKRRQITPRNTTLKDIINRIEDKNEAEKLAGLREKIKSILANVQRQNIISSELIKYSMKIVENSISVIANVLVPEGSAYNRTGGVKTSKEIFNISSVEIEA
jgi:hypothetical protein